MMAFLRSRWVVVSLGLLLMLYLLVFRFNAAAHLEKKQEAFFDAFESGKWEKIEDLLAPDYADQWEWDRNEMLLVLKDVRSQFLGLDVTLRQPAFDVAGDTGTVIGVLHVDGRGFGLADTAAGYVNRLDAPFTFSWRKTSFWPWSWQLVAISHPDMEKPNRYAPGDLIRMRQRNMGF